MSKQDLKLSVAILYQAEPPPVKDGVKKPMKPGGYSDSGADIGYALINNQFDVITPVSPPRVATDLDWVFPDTMVGITDALTKGANVLWLNTILFEGHPVQSIAQRDVSFVGQDPSSVDKYDDKIVTNDLLRSRFLPVPDSITITREGASSYELPFPFPVIVKPIRGRGSQGVTLVSNANELSKETISLLEDNEYGDMLYVEPYLPLDEITITVMPPGSYIITGKETVFNHYWSLPPVKRMNHINGVAPYNGTVAVINNSVVLTDEEMKSDNIRIVIEQCEVAASLVNAKAPIRIDCRADSSGKFFLFDVNMKPNMTGPSRPHRLGQDSLTALAARKIGWSFSDLLINMLRQRWMFNCHN